MPNRSPKFQLIQDRLGSDLASFIRQRRDDERSYELIAREMWARTGIDVSAQTVANWDSVHHSPTEGAA